MSRTRTRASARPAPLPGPVRRNDHHAQGYNFWLLHDEPTTASSDDNWRFCVKCHALFMDGWPYKGHCAAGGGHAAAGFNFVLYADISLSPQPWQGEWRFCDHCYGLFYDGYNLKGVCPAQDGGHGPAEPTSYNYSLMHGLAAEDAPDPPHSVWTPGPSG
jgi:hypothetical protein